MTAPRHVAIDCLQVSRFPFGSLSTLLQRWLDAEFDPPACASILERMLSEPRWGLSAKQMRPEAVLAGGRFATDDLLFAEGPWSIQFRGIDPATKQTTWTWQRDIADADLGLWASDLRAAVRLDSATAGFSGPRLDSDLRRRLLDAPRDVGRYPPAEAPGIYRREHGSILIRSATTTLLCDPVPFLFHYAGAPTNIDGARLDAVLITHGHLDHWNLASILYYADRDIPIIVPRVPRPSVLSPTDMAATLRACGQKSLTPAWGDTLRIGDIEIDILPFYGEQPTRDAPGPLEPELRNWGHCFRFNTPHFSAIALIDSGADPLGDMVDVVRASVARRGPPDVLLSSLPTFFSPLFPGLPTEFLTLPFDELRRAHDRLTRGELPSVTPGPEGILELLAATGPRHYLPYGKGFEGLGRPISDVGIHMGEPAEWDIVAALASDLGSTGAPTRAVPWNPGDHVTFEGGAMTRHVFAPPPGIAE